ncbi:MAG: bifunctional 4-hydroxy-2-oxoglutarate aldolase/2-dehydro-3-deoxy-phosphogluconate aldolase [Frankia sp.]|nr:bifunctional 4-hydroxy-2-oxoglutarate aldolase/2-dehydro-3-deoxy-phosphogluconate aldolase [Frankia sp.]
MTQPIPPAPPAPAAEDAAGTIAAIATDRVLPVIALPDAADAAPLGEALLAGGLRCAEVTFRTSAAAAAIRAMAALGELVVGAGTVLTPGQVDEAVAAGARFVVSPGFGPAVVRRCQELGVPVFPGVQTPTEIQLALDHGLDTVKFFPAAQAGGVDMIRALAAPFRSVRFIPTGGVSAANAADYLAIPAVLAVGGTWMVPGQALAARDWDRVRSLAAGAVAVARAARPPR